MVLNSGLDNACTISSGDGGTYTFFWQFIRYACFGTGATDPDPSQTGLDSQVGSRTDNRGGFSPSQNAGLDAGTNTIWAELTDVRVFNITAPVNAAEWGLAPQTTGNLSVRDLFYEDPNDPESDPIVISLDDGDQLQLFITLRVEAEWEYQSKSFIITGTDGNDMAGTHTGNATVSSGAQTTTSEIIASLRAVWPGGVSGTGGNLHVYLSDQSSVGKNQNFTAFSDAAATMTLETYTPGSYYRDHTSVFNPSEANGDHYAWCCSLASTTTSIENRSQGFRYILTSPAALTKANTHRLTLTLRKSITRA